MKASGRLALVFTPLLAVIAMGFGALHLYRAFLWFRSGNTGVALIYGLAGVGGFALGIALWSVRRRVNRPVD
jgi:hypothetical protein